jgi:hypothetical protein
MPGRDPIVIPIDSTRDSRGAAGYPRRSSRPAFKTGGLLALLLSMSAVHTQPPGPPATFEQANRLYEQGRYPEAIRAYESMLAAGQVSPAVYFNLGDACFKNGQVGRAIASFRRAEQQTPRDPDVRANLQFARSSVAGTIAARPARWLRWLPRLTLDEAAMATSAVIWFWFALLIAQQLRPPTHKPLRGLTRVAGTAAVAMIVCTAALWHARLGVPTAIVVRPEATVRFGPVEESQRAFTARDGVELEVGDTQGDWLQVTDASRRVGWLKRDDVVVLP